MIDKVKLLDDWIAALRSGEYRQCKGKFKAFDGNAWTYCVIGVLLEIAGSALNARGLSVWLKDGTNLIAMNDSGVSFTELAGVIEEHREEILGTHEQKDTTTVS